MEISETNLPGVLLLTPRRFVDDRGWFSETWNLANLEKAGIEVNFVQDNHSFSAGAGTLRGLHYQAPPHAQNKLVRCSRGAIWDVAVDVRVGSPSYGHWCKVELTADNGNQLFIPCGFLHGFVTLVPDSEIQYKVSDFYNAESDGSVLWNSLGIDWGLNDEPILSEKDLNAPAFDSWGSPFIYERTS